MRLDWLTVELRARSAGEVIKRAVAELYEKHLKGGLGAMRSNDRWGPEVEVEYKLGDEVRRGTYQLSQGPGVQSVLVRREGEREGKVVRVGSSGPRAIAIHVLMGF